MERVRSYRESSKSNQKAEKFQENTSTASELGCLKNHTGAFKTVICAGGVMKKEATVTITTHLPKYRNLIALHKICPRIRRYTCKSRHSALLKDSEVTFGMQFRRWK